MSRFGQKKAGSSAGSFGGINGGKQGGTPSEFAYIISTVALRLKLNPKIGYKKLVAQAMGTIEAENGFDGSLWFSQGANGHIGPYALSPAYGSVAQRMNKVTATELALKGWKSEGETWYKAWGQYEQGETEGTGEERASKFYKLAEEGLKKAGLKGYAGEPEGTLGEPKLPGQEVAEEAVNTVEETGEFLAELAATLFDFRKLGALAASAMAWFLKLIGKAIWDYVIHPALDWVERATAWYWTNFFGTGTEQGSGFGYVLRSNAGIITIAFWAFGYGALFTDGESLAPVGKASNSLLGQQFKVAEGKIARRSLIKPSEVKEKTPDKPKPKSTTVPIQRTQTFSVGRKRAVTVTGGGNTQITPREGKPSGSSRRQIQSPAPVARPQSESAEQGLILPAGVETPAQIKAKATAKLSPKQSGTRVDARSSSGGTPRITPRTGGKK